MTDWLLMLMVLSGQAIKFEEVYQYIIMARWRFGFERTNNFFISNSLVSEQLDDVKTLFFKN